METVIEAEVGTSDANIFMDNLVPIYLGKKEHIPVEPDDLPPRLTAMSYDQHRKDINHAQTSINTSSSEPNATVPINLRFWTS